MRRQDFLFHVPEHLVAQTPAEPRDAARLMAVRRETGQIAHHRFKDLPELLGPETVIALNDSRVFRARLRGEAATIFLLEEEAPARWLCVGDPDELEAAGETLSFPGSPLVARIEAHHPDGTFTCRFEGTADVEAERERLGSVPLPPYIKTEAPEARYQTVYARHAGSVAAPTAGLHFTQEVFARLDEKGVSREHLTLHVGYGTFAGVRHDDLSRHAMHAERFTLGEETAGRLNAARARGKTVLAVGTTSTRVLESCAADDGTLTPRTGETDIFIRPPYRFKHVGALLTNFHMPGLTPVMLVAAFAGYDLTMRAYEEAIREEYRFYSFGDAMLVL